MEKDTVAERLKFLLANTAVLYIKTLNFHWNMVGPQFFMYHKMLEGQYNELSEALDTIAERIRQLGPKAPATMQEYLSLATLKEGKSTLTQEKMVFELVRDHVALVQQCTRLIEFAEEKNDQGTMDLVIDRLRSHDKVAWLLRSNLSRK